MKTKKILNKAESFQEMNTRHLILELFRRKPGAIYNNQEEIAQAISKTFGVKRTQSAVSKALKEVENNRIEYKKTSYLILKADGYRLYKKSDVLDEITQSFAKKKVFGTYTAYRISKNIIAYSLKQEYISFVKEGIEKAFDDDSFFDIISHSNKLYFILNEQATIQEKLLSLPEIVKELEALQ